MRYVDGSLVELTQNFNQLQALFCIVVNFQSSLLEILH